MHSSPLLVLSGYNTIEKAGYSMFYRGGEPDRRDGTQSIAPVIEKVFKKAIGLSDEDISILFQKDTSFDWAKHLLVRIIAMHRPRHAAFQNIASIIQKTFSVSQQRSEKYRTSMTAGLILRTGSWDDAIDLPAAIRAVNLLANLMDVFPHEVIKVLNQDASSFGPPTLDHPPYPKGKVCDRVEPKRFFLIAMFALYSLRATFFDRRNKDASVALRDTLGRMLLDHRHQLNVNRSSANHSLPSNPLRQPVEVGKSATKMQCLGLLNRTADAISHTLPHITIDEDDWPTWQRVLDSDFGEVSANDLGIIRQALQEEFQRIFPLAFLQNKVIMTKLRVVVNMQVRDQTRIQMGEEGLFRPATFFNLAM